MKTLLVPTADCSDRLHWSRSEQPSYYVDQQRPLIFVSSSRSLLCRILISISVFAVMLFWVCLFEDWIDCATIGWDLMKKEDQSTIPLSDLIYKHLTASATTSACMVSSASINNSRYPPNLQIGFIFDQILIRSIFVLAGRRINYACGVSRILIYLVLILVCNMNGLIFPSLVLDLFDLGLVLKTHTTSTRSRSSSSTVTRSPKPSRPDQFRHRHSKTDSKHHCYMRHFGYCLRHIGYCLATVTISWVTDTLIALGNLNLKNSSSCYLHVLMNIGLDLIRSLTCALTYIGFALKTSLALNVWSSPLRERRFSEIVFRFEGIDLISKNWGRYCDLYDFCKILNFFCKVFDFLNRHYQYIV